MRLKQDGMSRWYGYIGLEDGSAISIQGEPLGSIIEHLEKATVGSVRCQDCGAPMIYSHITDNGRKIWTCAKHGTVFIEDTVDRRLHEISDYRTHPLP